jgi:endonuclease III
MTVKTRIINCVQALKNKYPEAICSLESHKPHELLIATRLSAQCTDLRVNMVTPELFKKFPTIKAFCEASIPDVEEIVKSCGLYKTKSRDIVNMCKMLDEKYNGIVPDTIEELIKLPGVGRKTANLVIGDVYHKPSVVVDTHCIRITNRLGFVKTKDPLKIELILKKLLPLSESNDFCHRIVLHGRATCIARNPKCQNCCLEEYCRKIL